MINKLVMFGIIVNDMPKAKEFYADKLGLNVAKDYRIDDGKWWVSLTLPDGGTSITLTTYKEGITPGPTSIWFATKDIAATHKELEAKGVKVSKIGDDLHGPGSGVNWFNFTDPDGNLVHIEQE
jgi:catechol 2,3-dioxygenase-like lactoylglutathione lyase family enzyme